MTEQTFTTAAGPVLVNLDGPANHVVIQTDPQLAAAQIRITTSDATGDSADLVHATRVVRDGHLLNVRIPERRSSTGYSSTTVINGGSVRISQNIGHVAAGQTFTGVVIDEFGNMTVGGFSGPGAGAASSPITVVITLPTLCGVRLNCPNAAIVVKGGLAALEASGHNGSLVADLIGRLKWNGHNGSITVDRLAETLDVQTHNGSTRIGAYSGSAVRLRAHNGSVSILAERTATGAMDVQTYNGQIQISGARHLDVRATTRRGRVVSH